MVLRCARHSPTGCEAIDVKDVTRIGLRKEKLEGKKPYENNLTVDHIELSKGKNVFSSEYICMHSSVNEPSVSLSNFKPSTTSHALSDCVK